MKLEEQELLLRDLCGRLPYWVKCVAISDGYIGCISSIESQYGVVTFDDGRQEEICDIKPCLYLLSNMTEEQYGEYTDMGYSVTERWWSMANYHQIDWCNKNHFDYRGLIEKGLAIDATGLNIYKEETK